MAGSWLIAAVVIGLAQQAAIDLARVYLRSGAIDKARAHVEAAIARRESAALRNLQGAIEARRGNIAGAAEAYRRAVEIDPTEAFVFDLGEHFLRYRGFDDAVKIFEYGLGRYPRAARLHVGLGIARYSLGEYDAAVESLCRAVDLDPADPRPLTFLGELHDVSPAMAEEVTRRLEGFVERYPANAQANYYYALSLWKRYLNQPLDSARAAAEKHLRTAIALDPRHAAAQFQLGLLLEDTGRLPGAIAAYNRAVRLDRSHRKAHYRLAQLYSRTGDRAAAQRYLQLFQQLQTTQAK